MAENMCDTVDDIEDLGMMSELLSGENLFLLNICVKNWMVIIIKLY